MKLDLLNRSILHQLDLNSRQPIQSLVDKLGGSRQRIEYRIKKLESLGIISGYHALISPTRTGKHLYKIYFKCRHSPKRKKELIKFLKSEGLVYWIGETTGAWDLLAGVAYKFEEELFQLIRETLTRFGDVIASYQGHIIVAIEAYEKRYFTGSLSEPLQFAGEKVDYKLSKLEGEVLKELVLDARVSIEKIAKKTNSTPKIIRTRIKELEEKQIILRYRLGVSLEKIKLEHYKVIFSINKCSEEDEKNSILLSLHCRK